ncbi:hypothetical protein S7335_4686 [Synechococcus sp. PCC 7335]|nr:hypothetical protein S7335_4686 [Synechococcus sp. PCC 7335]
MLALLLIRQLFGKSAVKKPKDEQQNLRYGCIENRSLATSVEL